MKQNFTVLFFYAHTFYSPSTFTSLTLPLSVKELLAMFDHRNLKNAPPRYFLFTAFFQIPVTVASIATQIKLVFKNSANWIVNSIHSEPFLNAIFLASNPVFIQRASMLVLPHFKSKGISVFLTHHQGQASLKNNLHPLGSIFFQNLGVAKHGPFMLVKRNKAYSGSLDE